MNFFKFWAESIGLGMFGIVIGYALITAGQLITSTPIASPTLAGVGIALGATTFVGFFRALALLEDLE